MFEREVREVLCGISTQAEIGRDLGPQTLTPNTKTSAPYTLHDISETRAHHS